MTVLGAINFLISLVELFIHGQEPDGIAMFPFPYSVGFLASCIAADAGAAALHSGISKATQSGAKVVADFLKKEL